MQTLSAYLLEATNLTQDEVAASAARIEALLNGWLIEKGALDPGVPLGSFVSKTKGSPDGRFQRRSAKSSMGAFEELTLQEPTSSGQEFATTIVCVALIDRVSVYTTLTVQNVIVRVAPVFTDPRCPAIVKRLIDLRSDWQLGGIAVPRSVSERISGSEGGKALISAIRDQARTLPIVVISEVEQEPVWDNLETLLAADLAGLARVVRIDEDASWELTSELGKLNSCYLGAVRLYWPCRIESDASNIPRGFVWTASYMVSLDNDGNGRQRIRSLLRRSVMGVAALTVEPPAAIREIQNQAARAKFLELEQRANSNKEEIEFARLFVEENEKLQQSLDEANREIVRQASKAEAAEYALSRIRERGGPDELETEDLADSSLPTAGETRYYKKIRNAPAHDVLVRTRDCSHNSWQGANGADKAKKGVEKLERTSSWSNFYHCAKCTGGGVWKVLW